MRILSFLLAILSFSGIHAQKIIDLNLGAGFPEVLTLGGHYYSNQQAIGLSGLYLPTSEGTYQIGLDYKYHAFGKTEKSHLRPWYIKGEALYRSSGERPFNDQSFFVFGRVGRSTFFNSNFGIELEAGLYGLVWEEHYSTFGPLIPRVFLGGGLLLFYRWEIKK